MVNLLSLKQNSSYLVVDQNGLYEPVIIRFKVVNELKNKKNRSKGCVEVQFLKYLYEYGEVDVKYADNETNEVILEKLYKHDELRIFKEKDIDLAQDYLDNVKYEYDWDYYEFDEYSRPEDYPDWDGDESIMYYIDHYTESDDDDEEQVWEGCYCGVCGNYVDEEDRDEEDSFTCPVCGAKQNI